MYHNIIRIRLNVFFEAMDLNKAWDLNSNL